MVFEDSLLEVSLLEESLLCWLVVLGDCEVAGGVRVSSFPLPPRGCDCRCGFGAAEEPELGDLRSPPDPPPDPGRPAGCAEEEVSGAEAAAAAGALLLPSFLPPRPPPAEAALTSLSAVARSPCWPRSWW